MTRFTNSMEKRSTDHVLDFRSLENERSVDVEVVADILMVVVVVVIVILEITIQDLDDVIHRVRTTIDDVVIHVHEVLFNITNGIIRLVHVHDHVQQHQKLVEIVHRHANVRPNNQRSTFNDTMTMKIKYKKKQYENQLNFCLHLCFVIFLLRSLVLVFSLCSNRTMN